MSLPVVHTQFEMQATSLLCIPILTHGPQARCIVFIVVTWLLSRGCCFNRQCCCLHQGQVWQCQSKCQSLLEQCGMKYPIVMLLHLDIRCFSVQVYMPSCSQDIAIRVTSNQTYRLAEGCKKFFFLFLFF